jgi:hypothetical protein
MPRRHESRKKRRQRRRRAAPPTPPARRPALRDPVATATAAYDTEDWFPYWRGAFQAIHATSEDGERMDAAERGEGYTLEEAEYFAEAMISLGAELASLPPYFIDRRIMADMVEGIRPPGNLPIDLLTGPNAETFAEITPHSASVPWSVFESQRGMVFSNHPDDYAVGVRAFGNGPDGTATEHVIFEDTLRLDAITFAIQPGVMYGIQSWRRLSLQGARPAMRSLSFGYVLDEATRQPRTDMAVTWDHRLIATRDDSRPPWRSSTQPDLSDGVVPGLTDGLFQTLAAAGVNFLHAAAQWMHEQAAPSRPRRVTRAQQRQADQAGIPAPRTGVRIVDLRRRAVCLDPTTATGSRAAPDYRFNVRGHWRNQAYGPGRRLRKRIWVPEYLKGPEHLPVRRTPVAFRVHRV